MARTLRRGIPEVTEFSLHVIIASDNIRIIHDIETLLDNRGYEPVIIRDLDKLLHFVESGKGPFLVIIDDRMQDLDATLFFRHVRSMHNPMKPYVLLIAPENISHKFPMTDDFLNFPLTLAELDARISLGMRIMELEKQLSSRTTDLKNAANKIKRLNGLLPICSHCKKIRDDKGYWNELEKYISDHSDAEFSHAICPGCLHDYYPEVKDESV
ncbi:MAG: response regulator [Syntrophorhabdaceae bacterium]